MSTINLRERMLALLYPRDIVYLGSSCSFGWLFLQIQQLNMGYALRWSNFLEDELITERMEHDREEYELQLDRDDLMADWFYRDDSD
jgi:hypothetical protein